MYYFNIGPFKKNVTDLEFLKEKYCSAAAQSAPQNVAICECIVKKAEKDMKSRFSSEELESMKTDKLKSAYVLQKSLEKMKTRSEICLEDQNQKDAMKKFTTDLASLDNEWLGKVAGWVNHGVDALKEKWNERKAEKTAIDDKYK